MDNITIVYLGNLNKSVTHVKHVQKQDFFFVGIFLGNPICDNAVYLCDNVETH